MSTDPNLAWGSAASVSRKLALHGSIDLERLKDDVYEHMSRVRQHFATMDFETAHYLLTQEPSASVANDLVKRIESLRDRVEEKQRQTPSGNPSHDASGSSNGTGVRNPDVDNYKANGIDYSMPSILNDDFMSFPSSNGSLPATQIVNHGGTINISYNIHPGTSHGGTEKGGLKVHGAGERVPEGRVSTAKPTRTYPPSPVLSHDKSVGKDHAPISGPLVKHNGEPSPDQSRSKLAQLDRDSTTNTSSVSFGSEVSPSPCKTESMTTTDAVIEGQKSIQGGSFDISLISFPVDGSLQSDPSGASIDARPETQDPFIDRSDPIGDGSNEIDTPSSLAETGKKAAGNAIAESTLTDQEQAQDSISKPLIRKPCRSMGEEDVVIVPCSATANSFMAVLAEEVKDSETNSPGHRALAPADKGFKKGKRGAPKEVTFDLPEDDEATEGNSPDTSSHFPGSRSKGKQTGTLNEAKPIQTMRGVTVRGGKSLMFSPSATSFIRDLRPRSDTQASNETEPRGARQQVPKAKENAKDHKFTLDTEQLQTKKKRNNKNSVKCNNGPGQKVEKPRPKKPTPSEAGQCEGDTTDTQASSSAGDIAARRAAVLDMLARMNGPLGGNTQNGGGVSNGQRDFSFLLPPPTESRKCRLCRTLFTDASNVGKADGGAPCSFHPGPLEDKTGNNTTYAFSCCGGPPIMVGPGLVAMNLVSPGCTKCYHQDRMSAWNPQTFKMKDPPFFEG